MIVRLRHVNHKVKKRREYFYDGSATAIYGVVSIDSSEPQHLRAAFFRGYRWTPENVLLRSFEELDTYVASLTAKSEENDHESKSDDSRRQPVNSNRVRSRQ